MRLMYVTPGLGRSGGAEQSLVAMAPFWRDRLDLHVVTLTPRAELEETLIAAGANVTRLDTRGSLDAARQLRIEIRRTSPDLVHSVLFDADIPARLAAASCRVPRSSSLVNLNYGPEQRGTPGRSSVKLVGAQALDAVTGLTTGRFHALTHAVANVMGRRLLIPAQRFEVIPRGRSRSEVGFHSHERRQRVRASLGVTDQPLIIATARHEWQKGLDTLIHSMSLVKAKYPDALLLIGGRDGEQTSHLHALARAAGHDPATTFIGSRTDVPDLMCAADAFCVPSRWEGLGSILIEALALGAPVVASDIAPFRELDPQARWLRYFEPERPSSLAGRLIQTIEDRASASPNPWAVQEFESQYTASAVAQRMADFFVRAHAPASR